MREFNALQWYPQPKQRVVGDNLRTIKSKIIASYRDERYYDGFRENGYGGYNYDGRWIPFIDVLEKHYGLNEESSILHIGCEKGFLMHDIRKKYPKIKLKGYEISEYAKAQSMENIKNDIIEASISSHTGDNYLDLFRKSILMNKYINKDIGKNAIYSYKRASNILDREKKDIFGKPDAVLFRKDEEKSLFEKINEIRKAFSVREEDKNYEKLLIQLSEIKSYTDNFFDNVVVNDENHDIKNNRLELLKMFCKTFNNFIDFSKLEGA